MVGIRKSLHKAELARHVVGQLLDRLPARWSLAEDREVGAADLRADLVLTLTGPDDSTARVVVELKQALEGRDIDAVAAQLTAVSAVVNGDGKMVGARYLSPQTRAKLTDRGIAYIDATGNLRLQLDQPALFLADRGADADPWRGPGRARGTLKGAPAADLVRAIVDIRSQWRVAELLRVSGVSTGAAYRVLDFLESEGLAQRPDRGVIAIPDWAAVLRRWSQDYGLVSNSRLTRWIAPRGLDDLTQRAAQSRAHLEYCFTGTIAASEWAPYAPARAAMIYTAHAPAAAELWGLRPTDAGANVLLAEPDLQVPLVRTLQREDGLILAAPAQVVVDLLTGPGRSPSEAEELLTWMQANEQTWRG